jgi:hypothetical protein
LFGDLGVLHNNLTRLYLRMLDSRCASHCVPSFTSSDAAIINNNIAAPTKTGDNNTRQNVSRNGASQNSPDR